MLTKGLGFLLYPANPPGKGLHCAVAPPRLLFTPRHAAAVCILKVQNFKKKGLEERIKVAKALADLHVWIRPSWSAGLKPLRKPHCETEGHFKARRPWEFWKVLVRKPSVVRFLGLAWRFWKPWPPKRVEACLRLYPLRPAASWCQAGGLP